MKKFSIFANVVPGDVTESLTNIGSSVGPWAQELLVSEEVKIKQAMKKGGGYTIVVANLSELGLTKPSSIKEIEEAGKKNDLKKIPAGLSALIMLKKPSMNYGAACLMDPIQDSGGEFAIYYLEKYLVRAQQITPITIFEINSKFMFME